MTAIGTNWLIAFEWTVDNLGSADLNWAKTDGPPNFGPIKYDCHPVFLQNVYRYRPFDPNAIYSGRFEQIGTSWLKHGTAAAFDADACTDGSDCDPPNEQYRHLGPNCRDLYTISENQNAWLLGPKWDLDPETGYLATVEYVHPSPYGAAMVDGGTIVVEDIDIHNPADIYTEDWSFFFEHLAYAADEAQSARPNNMMYKKIPTDWTIPDGFQLGHSSIDNSQWGSMVEIKGVSAMWAWKNVHDPLVSISASLDGKWLVGHRAKKVSATKWHYEYAVMNVSSADPAWAFDIPVGSLATITDEQFHDVDANSGEACRCNGEVDEFLCFDDTPCVFPETCRSANAYCTDNRRCFIDAQCDEQANEFCAPSGMCTNGQTCSIDNNICAQGWSCLALDYCIKSEDWSVATIPQFVRWETDAVDDSTNTQMVLRSNVIHWGEMNTFRFIANKPPNAVTAIIHLRSGATIPVPVSAP